MTLESWKKRIIFLSPFIYFYLFVYLFLGIWPRIPPVPTRHVSFDPLHFFPAAWGYAVNKCENFVPISGELFEAQEWNGKCVSKYVRASSHPIMVMYLICVIQCLVFPKVKDVCQSLLDFISMQPHNIIIRFFSLKYDNKFILAHVIIW